MLRIVSLFAVATLLLCYFAILLFVVFQVFERENVMRSIYSFRLDNSRLKRIKLNEIQKTNQNSTYAMIVMVGVKSIYCLWGFHLFLFVLLLWSQPVYTEQKSMNH